MATVAEQVFVKKNQFQHGLTIDHQQSTVIQMYNLPPYVSLQIYNVAVCVWHIVQIRSQSKFIPKTRPLANIRTLYVVALVGEDD